MIFLNKIRKILDDIKKNIDNIIEKIEESLGLKPEPIKVKVNKNIKKG